MEKIEGHKHPERILAADTLLNTHGGKYSETSTIVMPEMAQSHAMHQRKIAERRTDPTAENVVFCRQEQSL